MGGEDGRTSAEESLEGQVIVVRGVGRVEASKMDLEAQGGARGAGRQDGSRVGALTVESRSRPLCSWRVRGRRRGKRREGWGFSRTGAGPPSLLPASGALPPPPPIAVGHGGTGAGVRDMASPRAEGGGAAGSKRRQGERGSGPRVRMDRAGRKSAPDVRHAREDACLAAHADGRTECPVDPPWGRTG